MKKLLLALAAAPFVIGFLAAGVWLVAYVALVLGDLTVGG